MNLGVLKKLIEGLDDSTEVLIPRPDSWASEEVLMPSSDHNYRRGDFRIAALRQEKPDLWVEDDPEAECGKCETVLIVD